MSLAPERTAAINQGWARALLLLFAYVLCTSTAGILLTARPAWFVASLLVPVGLVYLFRTLIDKRSFSSLGLEKENALRHAALGLLTAACLISACTLTIFLLNGITWHGVWFDTASLAASFLFMLSVAFSEELVFRGYILRNLRKSFSRWKALVISSLLFTLVHAGNAGVSVLAMLNIFLGGMFLGVCCLQTRSLWMPVFMHFGWNFLQGPIVGFAVSGLGFQSVLAAEAGANALISGGRFGLEGSVVCAAFLTAAVAIAAVVHTKYTSAEPNG